MILPADGYGHGAIATALYLADNMGADCFAVATLEEGVALRRAFQDTPPGMQYAPSGEESLQSQKSGSANDVTLLFQQFSRTNSAVNTESSTSQGIKRRRYHRAPQIRILVLGAPLNYPRCFDDYFYHNIEVMISGPEVAEALLEWVSDTGERKRLQVERAAAEAKERAMQLQSNVQQTQKGTNATPGLRNKSSDSDSSNGDNFSDSNSESFQKYRPPPATLGNVTGMDLAKELRMILTTQKMILNNQKKIDNSMAHSSETASLANSSMGAASPKGVKATKTQLFAGIEEAAKNSRSRHKAIAKVIETNADGVPRESSLWKSSLVVGRKRLRWHALVDSGMGRLGFRIDTVSSAESEQRRDTVDIIKELLNLEDDIEAPVEFFGMCTHMADAGSSSYTNSQIERFKVSF